MFCIVSFLIFWTHFVVPQWIYVYFVHLHQFLHSTEVILHICSPIFIFSVVNSLFIKLNSFDQTKNCGKNLTVPIGLCLKNHLLEENRPIELTLTTNSLCQSVLWKIQIRHEFPRSKNYIGFKPHADFVRHNFWICCISFFATFNH